MKVIVTGSAGFIGFHLSKALLEKGDMVIGVDNLNNYYNIKLKQDRNKILAGFANYHFYKADIAKKEKLFSIFEREKPDRVINLAAHAGVRHSLENPFVYEESNLRGFLNVLEACRKYEVKSLIYASSSSVYGNNKKVPFSETDRVDEPISLYAATKKSNEEMAFTYHHLFGLNVTGLRFFTVYGPYGRPDMAYFSFADSITQGKPIQLFNKGKMKRDFTYVEDIVQGIISALAHSYPCEIFNLGMGETQTLSDFVFEVEKNLGLNAKKELLPLQPGDVIETSADISKAKKLLGYNPKVNMGAGLKKFVEWYKSYYKK